jgi:hypothetical protein
MFLRKCPMKMEVFFAERTMKTIEIGGFSTKPAGSGGSF